MRSQRIEYIDMAKGIGIILVVIGHVIGEGGMSFFGSSILRNYIYSFHMALFFILSGILMGKAKANYSVSKDSFRKRLIILMRKLLVPYFIWSIIYFILDNESLGGAYNVYEALICMISFRGKAPIWFLGALFWAEICTIIVMMKFRHNEWLLIFTALLAIFVIILWKYYDPSIINGILIDYFEISILRGLICLLFVLIGYLIASKVLQEGHVLFELLSIICLFSISLVLFLLYGDSANLHTFSINNIYIFLCNGICCSLYIILLCKNINNVISCNVLKRIGECTLGIMCIHYLHFPFMHYATEICKYLGTDGFLSFLISFIFVFCISYVATETLKRVDII